MHCPTQKTSPVRSAPGVLATVVLLVMAACGRDDDANRAAPGGDGAAGGTASELPVPEGAIGSVTGMPANPGPGTSLITPVEPAPDAYSEVDGIEAMVVQPHDALDHEDPLADAPQIIIVPEAPHDPVSIDVDPGMPDPTAPPQPIGTEAATESTTFVIEPAETGD